MNLKKITLIFILLFIVSCSACAKIQFEDALGNKASYSRFGRTELRDVVYTNGSVSLKVKKVQADAGNLGEALNKTSETLLNISKGVAIP